MNRVPVGARPVSEHIAGEMAARGWTRYRLILRLGGDLRLAFDVLHDRCPIAPEISARLGRAFGVEPGYFLNLDRAYRESQQQPDTTEEETLP